MATTEQLEHVREYGFFDGLYGREMDTDYGPTELGAYLDGWWAGLAERQRWNERRVA